MDLSYEERVRLTKLIEDYKAVDAYRRANVRLDYMRFDYAVMHDLTLFMIEPDFGFDVLERHTDVILGALPAIKRIFAQPCIHLKEHNVILPVESVRTINNDTLHHIASHSELWSDVKNGEIKPDKLLTRTYEDNYGIYENLVFCRVVDNILAFARSNMRALEEIVYTNQTIEFNLLERVNHLNYFVALGKIHIGYSQNYAAHFDTAVRCLNKLQFIANTVASRLKRPVYKNNKQRHDNIKLRKTNILSMHKEYHKIYKLALYFTHNAPVPVMDITDEDALGLIKNYFFFCQALCIFAIGHFNFECAANKPFDMSKLSLSFSFKKWTVKLERVKVDKWQVLSLTVKKNKQYRIVLIPSLLRKNKNLVQVIKDAAPADEHILCSPYDEPEGDAVLVGITSIESFRRIQQILLRGMIYADSDRDDCPFCNGTLKLSAEKSIDNSPVYECVSCRTEICTAYCMETGEPYFYTDIAGQVRPQTNVEEEWLKKRNDESKMYFRNITEINDALFPVCPHCGKAHVWS